MQQTHYCKDCKYCNQIREWSMCNNPEIVGMSFIDGKPKEKPCGLIRIDATCSGFEYAEVIPKTPPPTTEYIRKIEPPPIRLVKTFTWKSLFNFFKKD